MPLSEEHRRKRGRNFALAGVLLLLVVLFFAVTVVKMKGGG
ncbi:MAG: hypothetical protein QF893_21840 [Alphaproteobacteria bacterium]|jgi:hypothetical protein|nr:hypothetical protein [Alphaproteobacteria bacterium]